MLLQLAWSTTAEEGLRIWLKSSVCWLLLQELLTNLPIQLDNMYYWLSLGYLSNSRSKKEVNSRTFRPWRSSSATKRFVIYQKNTGQLLVTVCICTCMCVYAQVHTAISSLYPTVPNRYMMRYSSRHWPECSSRHWLDSLVGMQSSKSADVHARTFDTLRRYSLTEVGKERQTKHTGVTIHYFHTSMCLLTSTTRIAHKSPHSARQHVLLTRSGVSEQFT